MIMKQKHMQNTEINKSAFNKCAAITLLSGLCFLILCGIAVVIVDPFFHYHAPLDRFPYEIDNQLSQNPGMARHMDYDSVIFGSSMTVNFDTDWFREEMGLDTLKLSYSGAYPRDISNIGRIVFDSGHDVKAVFLGVDVTSYSGAIDEIKFPIPEYLYDDNLINDVSYIFNKDVLLEYIVRPVLDPDPTDLSTVYSSWWTDEYYNENYVLPEYLKTREQVVSEGVQSELPEDYFTQAICDNMDVNIIPMISEHPDTEFVCFFPPYSILFWDNCMIEGRLSATLREYELISQMLLEYDNVRIFFFADEEDIITDLNNYADYTHYHPRFNHYMTKCFADGTGSCEDMEDVRAHVENLRGIIDEYDFDALFR